ncbi:hypothetical protein [Arthrobacter sp. B1I2]|uniref:hypothetical protein n=1 Tax=Arthrobacter sp. B1I2 TaxID=3042263 RepID=UPI00277E8F7D|nr:hypothetical protein [Arthrobacter sp. B1I2]MDQ0733225.1 hypothetical protein [Arthrobacter sp. B1I2]
MAVLHSFMHDCKHEGRAAGLRTPGPARESPLTLVGEGSGLRALGADNDRQEKNAASMRA